MSLTYSQEDALEYDDSIYPLGEEAFIEPLVNFLKAFSKGTKALELGVGTGRIAIPLAKEGYEVLGLDLSEAMLEQMMMKSQLVTPVQGNMAKFDLDKDFDLVYVVMNGLSYLNNQNQQISALKSAYQSLKSNGVFVIEQSMPRLDMMTDPWTRPFALESDYIGFDKINTQSQLVESTQIDLVSGDKQVSHHRYLWPSELTLMARIAGFSSISFYGDWDASLLENDSDQMIAVLYKTKEDSNES